VQAQVAAVLGHAVEAVPRAKGFMELGLDSLGSFELLMSLQKALECRLPTTITFDRPNVESLSAYLMNEVLDIPFAEATSAAGEGELECLSRDELAALLADELSHPVTDSAPRPTKGGARGEEGSTR
jgi:acyl carrier protein